MRLSILKTCLLLLLIGWVSNALAQTPVDVLSPIGIDVSQPGFVIVKYVGNVKIRHQDMLLFCDYALRNKTTNRIDAYGHILLVQGDSVVVRGDTLLYEGNDRHASLRGRVMFQDRRTVLTTIRLDYYLPSGIARATAGIRIADGRQVLNSQGGSYSVRTKQYTNLPDNGLVGTDGIRPADPVRDIQLAVAIASTGLTDATGISALRENWYSTAHLARLLPQTVPGTSADSLSVSDVASLAAGTKTGGPVVAKTENLLRSGWPGRAVGKPRSKGWLFDRPVVARSDAPVVAKTPVAWRKNESVIAKKAVAQNVMPAPLPVRPAPISTGKPAVVSQKTVVVLVKTVSVKEVIAEPATSELELELNRVRRAKLNRRTGSQNAQ